MTDEKTLPTTNIGKLPKKETKKEIKNIRVKEDVWWELNKLKVKLKITSLSELIERLIKENKIK